ncbi:MAG: M23 family metallopeptidase [Anaerolineales bacterium]|nr:M23 family metallopeptidase [Anaerolineales bacterium]
MRANIDLAAYGYDLYDYAEDSEEWPLEAYDEQYAEQGYYYPPQPRQGLLEYVNSYTIVAVLLLLVFVYGAISKPTAVSTNRAIPSTQETAATTETAVSTTTQSQPKIDSSGDASFFEAPYANYQITQGPHGYSYGHMAIDLAAGRGEPILSPINGVVTALYTDEYGNPTLNIENDIYLITLMHGDYTVQVGDKLRAGDPVGTESNHGYTMDMQGNLCYGREWCGNHSHLNVYDKRIGSNVNPLDLIGR